LFPTLYLPSWLFSAGFITASYEPPDLPIVTAIPGLAGMESLLFISALFAPGPPKLATFDRPTGPASDGPDKPPMIPGAAFF
jgi:hypothetical protein